MNNENVKITVNESQKIEVYEPKITRKTCTRYELARIITELALHLYNLSNIEKYVEDQEIDNIIDPCTLAVKLLMEHKFDAIIDRRYEKVTFSKLIVDKLDIDMIMNYLKQQEMNRKSIIFERLNLLK